jgi:two-component system, NtrC family, response regulator GlrR
MVEREDEIEAIAGPGSGRTLHTVQLVRSSDGSHAVMPPLTLTVTAGVDRGLVHAATGQRVVVGVHPSADLVLHDGTVSRFHCEVAVDGDHVSIKDLGSRNGTFVDGVSIVHAHLKTGSRIAIGSSELEFGLGREPLRIEISKSARFGALVGESTPMRAVFALLDRAAKSEATVLLSGETGTGKEIAAESLHAASARGKGPFVVVDCGAIPGELLESELFGHEKGAFTGAVNARAGAFEVAEGGTVFLDEIGELGLELQPKLLRVLERKHLKRVGQSRYVPVDVRVIAATNRNLQSEVNSRRFRADLYYRLAVLEVRLPALRERPEDVPLLVEHILAGLGASSQPEAAVLRGEAAALELMRHPWPGNVRELRNYVERCLALADRGPLSLPDAGGEAPAGAELDRESGGTSDAAPGNLRSARQSWLREFEKRYLEELLAQNGGNVSAAARSAGIDRKYLYRLLWRNGLR